MKTASKYLIFVLLLTSCYVDDESSFIKEPFDPRMPQYSEEGANTAGAYIDGQPWVSRKRIISSIFSPSPYTKGTMSFYGLEDSSGTFVAFEGGDLMLDQSTVSGSVGIVLGELYLSHPDDLDQLDNKRVELDGTINYGQMILQNDFSQLVEENAGTGVLHIRNVVKTAEGDWNISGTFGFSINGENQEATVYSGRFDYEVSDEQFHEF